jgi:hypothetical protein
MQSEIKALRQDVKLVLREIEVIKNVVLDDGEMTDWAKKELEEARKIPRSEYISHDEVKRRILKK